MVDFYCVRCREKRTGKEIKEITLKNEKKAIKAICEVCGTKMFHINGLNSISKKVDEEKNNEFLESSNFYCVKCKKMRKGRYILDIKLRDNNSAEEAICEACGSTMFRVENYIINEEEIDKNRNVALEALTTEHLLIEIIDELKRLNSKLIDIGDGMRGIYNTFLPLVRGSLYYRRSDNEPEPLYDIISGIYNALSAIEKKI